MIDFHTHILPGIDDGSSNSESSIMLLKKLKKQGVSKVLLTPHFYAYSSNAENFCETRKLSAQNLLKALENDPVDIELYLGCEVLYFDEIWRIEKIRDFPEKEKLHLSCNLIKGYVDCDERVKEYLDKCSEIDVRDVGFVSLMPINEYAKEHSIDFSDLDLKFNNRFIINQYFDRVVENKCVCKCCNYLYLSGNGNLVTAYSRYYVDNTNTDGALVFMDNNLRQGFTGNIII
jgi:hypothetical protein